MQETSKYTVFNIREYLGEGKHGLGEDTLFQILSEFSCKINHDVERFVKEQSVEFAKKQQSVTYLIFSTEDAELVGYFAIAIKPITVNAKSFSNTVKRKLSRVSTLNEKEQTYNLAAYLIAQLGKNYDNGANERGFRERNCLGWQYGRYGSYNIWREARLSFWRQKMRKDCCLSIVRTVFNSSIQD